MQGCSNSIANALYSLQPCTNLAVITLPTPYMIPNSDCDYRVDRNKGFMMPTDAYVRYYPDSEFHGANMGPTWVLSAPGGPHVGPKNLAIRVNINV